MAEEKPQYYADFDDSGNISGFYLDQIHGENIPATALPISAAEWQTYSADANIYMLAGGIIRKKTADEIEAEREALPQAPPSRVEELEAENADLWYEVMLEQARNDTHDTDIADLYYEIMTGGAPA